MTTTLSAYGPPASLYRIRYTTSKIGWRVERWNRSAGEWKYIGHKRQQNIVNTLVRVGAALWAPVVDER
jgi:hypothetical protein